MKTHSWLLVVVVVVWGSCCAFSQCHRRARRQRFEVLVSPSAQSGPITGRSFILAVAKRSSRSRGSRSRHRVRQSYGIDLDQLRPGQNAVVDERAVGYPMRLGELPSGDYFVQALILPYDRVEPDGHTIWFV